MPCRWTRVKNLVLVQRSQPRSLEHAEGLSRRMVRLRRNDPLHRRSAAMKRTALTSRTFAFALMLVPPPALAPASAQSISEQQAYEIARDAYVYAYPIVTMDVSMRQSTNVPNASTIPLRAPINQFAHARTYPRAE